MRTYGLLLLFLVLFGEQTLAEEDTRIVRVTGTSITRVPPDQVTWTVQVSNRNENLDSARQASDVAVEKVLALKQMLGLEDRDIQTSHLRIDKVYRRDSRGNQGEFRHFLISRTLTIRQTDLSKFDRVLQKLSSINEVEASYQLGSSKYHDIRHRTRLDAVRAARAKAQAMTELLGAKLGPVMMIDATEKNGGSRWGSNRFSNNMVTQESGAGAPDVEEGTFAPGSIQIQVSVEIAFEIDV